MQDVPGLGQLSATGVATPQLTVEGWVGQTLTARLRCRVFSGCHELHSEAADLLIRVAPSVWVTGPARTCPTGVSVFHASVAGTAPAMVSWQWAAVADGPWSPVAPGLNSDAAGQSFVAAGEATEVLTVALEQQAVGAQYYFRAVAGNMCGSAESSAAVLSVEERPEVVYQPPAEVDVCAGTQYALAVQSQLVEPASAQWQAAAVESPEAWVDLVDGPVVVAGRLVGTVVAANGFTACSPSRPNRASCCGV